MYCRSSLLTINRMFSDAETCIINNSGIICDFQTKRRSADRLSRRKLLFMRIIYTYLNSVNCFVWLGSGKIISIRYLLLAETIFSSKNRSFNWCCATCTYYEIGEKYFYIPLLKTRREINDKEFIELQDNSLTYQTQQICRYVKYLGNRYFPHCSWKFQPLTCNSFFLDARAHK